MSTRSFWPDTWKPPVPLEIVAVKGVAARQVERGMLNEVVLNTAREPLVIIDEAILAGRRARPACNFRWTSRNRKTLELVRPLINRAGMDIGKQRAGQLEPPAFRPLAMRIARRCRTWISSSRRPREKGASISTLPCRVQAGSPPLPAWPLPSARHGLEWPTLGSGVRAGCHAHAPSVGMGSGKDSRIKRVGVPEISMSVLLDVECSRLTEKRIEDF